MRVRKLGRRRRRVMQSATWWASAYLSGSQWLQLRAGLVFVVQSTARSLALRRVGPRAQHISLKQRMQERPVMAPSGQTLPANTRRNQKMSTAETHHGIVVGVDGSPPSKVAVRGLGNARCRDAQPSADHRPHRAGGDGADVP